MSNLSQAEIDELLRTSAGSASPPAETGDRDADETGREDILRYFTPEEVDALGEIGNICMGNSATTMHTLIGRKVTITTPTVEIYRTDKVVSPGGSPYLAISVEFIEGVYGKNLLILKDYDAALITDLLMGGEGQVDKSNIVLTEIHLSAVSEVMNQMIGAAATAMSNMMGDGINITPPSIDRMEPDQNVGRFLEGATPVVRISFDMEIEGLLKSKLLQIMTIDMAKELITSLMHPAEEPPEPPQRAVSPAKPAPAPAPRAAEPRPAAAPRAPERSRGSERPPAPEPQRVKAVKPADYLTFDESPSTAVGLDSDLTNFDLINDIPLQVTVELGKTKKNLSDVLGVGPGSIIVLDKMAGELVDVIVNGKRIAKGEVVVIDENYGVRITELMKA